MVPQLIFLLELELELFYQDQRVQYYLDVDVLLAAELLVDLSLHRLVLALQSVHLFLQLGELGLVLLFVFPLFHHSVMVDLTLQY